MYYYDIIQARKKKNLHVIVWFKNFLIKLV